MTVTAYGGLRGELLEELLAAMCWLLLAWIDRYLTGEHEKGLPRESYLSHHFD